MTPAFKPDTDQQLSREYPWQERRAEGSDEPPCCVLTLNLGTSTSILHVRGSFPELWTWPLPRAPGPIILPQVLFSPAAFHPSPLSNESHRG